MMHGPGGPRFLLEQQTSKPKNVFSTLGRFASYFRPYWLVLLLVAVCMVVGAWAQVTSPDLTGQVVDCYLTPALAGNTQALGGLAGASNQSANTNCWYATVNPNRTMDETVAGLGGLILLLVGLYVGGAILGGLQFFLMTWAGQHVLTKIRVQIFEHIHRLSLSYYAENEAGNVMSRITNDTDTIQQAISFALINVVSGALLLVWIAFNMLHKSIAYALLSMAVVPLMIVATTWFSGQARKAFRRTRKEIGNVNANLQESIAGVREVQAFNREQANISEFERTNAANRDANIRAVSFTAALAPTLEALGYLAIAIVVVAGGLALLRNQDLFGTTVSLGLIVTFLAYVQRFNQPIQQISVMWTNIQSAIAGGERIFELLDIEPAIKDKPNAMAMPQIQGKVEFVDVAAEYVKGEPVLNGISLCADPGQTVAIVGPTGAGKTTIINLIPRFYDVTGGEVRIDDIDVRDVTRESLRKQIGIVLQDTFLFSDTVMNNIRFGRLDATDEEVIAAAKLVHADSFIERLPKKYDTLLGERGAGISQGQRQLISIARAALANPRILILDEATSSVDTRTERLIQQALEKLLHGRTSFVIAHRLSTIRNADQVLVIQDGKLVERGKHDELLAKGGVYHDLYMSQFRREEQPSSAKAGLPVAAE
ncbi:MAG: ABC transporter ATP-binding protein [Chloroflexi bacterium]|nr:ABC transporter ATP-binding protein [Chloroflexota bacterium]